MSFTQISSFEAKELIGDGPYEQMLTYIFSDPIDSRLGVEKLTTKAKDFIKRDIAHGESFFFINKALNHFKVIYKGDHGIDMIERKINSGTFNVPPVKSMPLNDLVAYLEGNPVLH